MPSIQSHILSFSPCQEEEVTGSAKAAEDAAYEEFKAQMKIDSEKVVLRTNA